VDANALVCVPRVCTNIPGEIWTAMRGLKCPYIQKHYNTIVMVMESRMLTGDACARDLERKNTIPGRLWRTFEYGMKCNITEVEGKVLNGFGWRRIESA
jgi:hypothetical protein